MSRWKLLCLNAPPIACCGKSRCAFDGRCDVSRCRSPRPWSHGRVSRNGDCCAPRQQPKRWRQLSFALHDARSTPDFRFGELAALRRDAPRESSRFRQAPYNNHLTFSLGSGQSTLAKPSRVLCDTFCVETCGFCVAPPREGGAHESRKYHAGLFVLDAAPSVGSSARRHGPGQPRC